MNFGLRHIPTGHLLRLQVANNQMLLKAGPSGMVWSSTEPWAVQRVLETGDENRSAGTITVPIHLHAPEDLELVCLSEAAKSVDISQYPKPVLFRDTIIYPPNPTGAYIRAIAEYVAALEPELDEGAVRADNPAIDPEIDLEDRTAALRFIYSRPVPELYDQSESYEEPF